MREIPLLHISVSGCSTRSNFEGYFLELPTSVELAAAIESAILPVAEEDEDTAGGVGQHDGNRELRLLKEVVGYLAGLQPISEGRSESHTEVRVAGCKIGHVRITKMKVFAPRDASVLLAA